MDNKEEMTALRENMINYKSLDALLPYILTKK